MLVQIQKHKHLLAIDKALNLEGVILADYSYTVLSIIVYNGLM